ncbi:MAG: hypothetical protein WBM07_04065 [Chitinivibrionales bacterium]
MSKIFFNYIQCMKQSAVFSFPEILLSLVNPRVADKPGDISDVEPFSRLDYGAELGAKNRALAEFWKKNRRHGSPQQVIASPMPRFYRTTTKRRVFFSHNKFRLRFSHHKDDDGALHLASDLEPREHDVIYRFILEKINTPGFSHAAKHLTYIIIRGSYTEFCVLFNVANVNGAIVRNLKALAENLRKFDKKIISAFIFHDPTRSEYYLDNKQSGGAWKIKNLFGPDALRLKVHDQTYRYDPVSFSQVNQSILPLMLDTVSRLCAPGPDKRLIDLYCGYGLFTNYVGKRFGEVYGIDFDDASVERARETARFTAQKSPRPGRMYFRTAAINVSSLEALLPIAGPGEETVLLDPPRQGPGMGVVRLCAQRSASRIVHIFCNVDRIPADLDEWQRYGYRVSQVVPFDMFPGTPNLEVAVLLEPF